MSKCSSIPVELPPDEHLRLRGEPKYYLQGFSKEPRVFMQDEVKRRLFTALEALDPGYGMIVWDAYRSREVHGVMFEWMKKQVRARTPHFTDIDLHEETKKYMSPLSRVGDAYCAPHLSGGAIDLTIYDVTSGAELPMGTPFDDCTEKAHTHYYEGRGDLTPEELRARDRRRVLCAAMWHAGFVVSEYEWWHFDYGDLVWSKITGQPELFGPLFGDAEGVSDV